jgi:hypothetical protein
MKDTYVLYLQSFYSNIQNIVEKLPNTFIQSEKIMKVTSSDSVEFFSEYSDFIGSVFSAILSNVHYDALTIETLEQIHLFLKTFLHDYFKYFRDYFVELPNLNLSQFFQYNVDVATQLDILLSKDISNFNINGIIISISDNVLINQLFEQLKTKIYFGIDTIRNVHNNLLNYIETDELNNSNILYPKNFLNSNLALNTLFEKPYPLLFDTTFLLFSYKPFNVVKKMTDFTKKPLLEIIVQCSKENLYDLPLQKEFFIDYSNYIFAVGYPKQQSKDYNFNTVNHETFLFLIPVCQWNTKKLKAVTYTYFTKPFDKRVIIIQN